MGRSLWAELGMSRTGIVMPISVLTPGPALGSSPRRPNLRPGHPNVTQTPWLSQLLPGKRGNEGVERNAMVHGGADYLNAKGRLGLSSSISIPFDSGSI
jgi:hypothetical protein